MIQFKRQTSRSTRQDSTQNINIFLSNFSIGVRSSKSWGDFTQIDEDNPHIEISLDGKDYELSLSQFKDKLRRVLK